MKRHGFSDLNMNDLERSMETSANCSMKARYRNNNIV